MQDNLLQQGFELMLYGMLFVFVFLLALIAIMSLVSAIVQRFPAEEPVVAVNKPRPAAVSKSAAAMPDARVLAVIQAAVAQHRSRD